MQECVQPTSTSLNSGEPDVLSPGIKKELQEQFHVYLLPNSKLDVFGECLLQVTHENIYLWDIVNVKIKQAAWPLTSLRRYGSDNLKFTFESGRHCDTGEGKRFFSKKRFLFFKKLITNFCFFSKECSFFKQWKGKKFIEKFIKPL